MFSVKSKLKKYEHNSDLKSIKIFDMSKDDFVLGSGLYMDSVKWH